MTSIRSQGPLIRLNFESMNQMLQPLDIQALDDQTEQASTASAAPADMEARWKQAMSLF
jgi:hypothetical protein